MVSGASGSIGKVVVDLLLEDGTKRVVAGTRTPEGLADQVARGAIARELNFDDPEGAARAFESVDRLLIISTQDAFEPGRRLRQQTNAVQAAVRAGVQHIVYTSMPNPHPGTPLFFASDHYGTEQAMANSGITWTVLRNAWYHEITFPILRRAMMTGRWLNNTNDGLVPYVAREDCSAAAAAVLINGTAPNEIVNLTGPDDLTVTDMSKIATEVLSTRIDAVQSSDTILGAFIGLMEQRPPEFPTIEDYIHCVVTFDQNTRMGRAGTATGDVERLIGRKPRTYREVLSEHTELFLGRQKDSADARYKKMSP